MHIDRGRRICGGFLCFLIICLFVMPMTAHAAESKTVRVGFYSRENYHTVDENGVHSGYAYEYLMKIASYTGWNYEFIPGTLDECLDMLERGEIDLLTGI